MNVSKQLLSYAILLVLIIASTTLFSVRAFITNQNLQTVRDLPGSIH